MDKLFRLLIFFGYLFSGEISAHEVMTWVSPYYINESKTVLEKSYGGIPVKSALSRIGLQFWNITTKSTVNLQSNINKQITVDEVKWWASWGKQNNIKILLTVVNDGGPEYGNHGFDWRLVRAACYGNKGNTLIVNLLAEVEKYDLAGIDLDLEGEDGQGPYTNDDKIKYAVFVNNLCDSLHARGKICTIDSYSETEYGAPRASWWSSWKGRIDAIHTMGYTSEYWSNPTVNSYQGLQDMAIGAGIEPQKLLFGLPMWVDKWAGSSNNMGVSNIDNLNYIQNCLKNKTGITLWDIHAPADVIKGTTTHPWTADAVWKLIKAIHDGKSTDPAQCPANPSSGKIIDDMSNIGMNLKGGIWSAFSDNWGRTATDQANSTKVLTSDRIFDMALQYGTYGDIAPGYAENPGSGLEIKSIIKTLSKSGANAAEAGFMMNFMPVDRSLDSSAQAWEIAKVGVERDLSSYKKLVIGAQGTAGKKIRIYLVTKAQQTSYAAGYGGYFTCSGKYEDFELSFASLKPIWGSGPTGFDAKHALRLTVEYVDLAPPSELILNISGVALDTSVVSIKHLTKTQAVQNRTENSFYQIRSDGIYFNSAEETTVSLYSIEGKLVFSSTFCNDHLKWASSIPASIYVIRIRQAQQTFAEKMIILNKYEVNR